MHTLRCARERQRRKREGKETERERARARSKERERELPDAYAEVRSSKPEGISFKNGDGSTSCCCIIAT